MWATSTLIILFHFFTRFSETRDLSTKNGQRPHNGKLPMTEDPINWKCCNTGTEDRVGKIEAWLKFKTRSKIPTCFQIRPLMKKDLSFSHSVPSEECMPIVIHLERWLEQHPGACGCRTHSLLTRAFYPGNRNWKAMRGEIYLRMLQLFETAPVQLHWGLITVTSPLLQLRRAQPVILL